MELGYAFVVTVPNNIVEEKLLKLLKERLENYPVIACDWHAQLNGSPGGIPGPKYPADWLISSRDNAVLTLQDGTDRIAGWGLIIRCATGDDLERILPNQFHRYKSVD